MFYSVLVSFALGHATLRISFNHNVLARAYDPISSFMYIDAKALACITNELKENAK